VGLADDQVPADGKAVYSFEQVLKVALDEERPTLRPGRDCTVEDALNDYWAYREAKRFHDLRRSYGSLLLNRGGGAEVIQELLGHADLRMTRRVYAHLMQRTIARVVKKKLPSFGLERSNVTRLKP
jgi:integrase